MKKKRPGNLWWLDENDKSHYLHTMGTPHIKNILNCLNGGGKSTIPNPHCALEHSIWKKELNAELQYRGEIVSKELYEIY